METAKSFFARRNPAIDMLRALTMFVMIFVNDLWSIHDVPRWLEHAEYGVDFAGLADFVFPCFLFAMGMSIPYAIENRYAKGLSSESTLSHILSRTFALLVMGVFTVNSGSIAGDLPYNRGAYYILMFIGFVLVWNRYPNMPKYRLLWTALKCVGWAILLYLMFTLRHPDGSPFKASWWGILGLLGWAYLFCAVSYMLLRKRPAYLILVFSLALLVCILNTPLRAEFGAQPLLPVPEGHFYGSLLGIVHVGNGCLVSLTLGGVMLSLAASRLCRMNAGRRLLLGLGAALAMLGVALVFHRFFIVSKLGETPTWVFYTYAIATALYFLLARLAELDWTGWFALIKPAGTATLTAYLMPYVAYGVAGEMDWHVRQWLTYGGWGIAVCLLFSLLMIWIAGLLGKLHINLKI